MNEAAAVAELRRRFWQTERRVEKEIASLQDVAQRLFLVPTATAEWVATLVAVPEGRDRLEYVEDPVEFAAALNRAHEMLHTLLAAAFALRDAAEKQFPEDPT
ncbi:uncharacterized protein E1O_12630 [Burkholderiales bacterium GJ-E10]|nr:uncharacterized protein E1O_12630 [Burkholderiales bacterium GJ-E10]